MALPELSASDAFGKLIDDSGRFSSEDHHLKHLLSQPDRIGAFSRSGGGLFFDFSRQRLDGAVVDLLVELAGERRLAEQFSDMVAGRKVNVTEARPALHTACRDFSKTPLTIDGENVSEMIAEVRRKIETFVRKIHAGEIRGTTDKPFKHVVVIGIGGSYLGPEFVTRALDAYADKGLALHYLANVDIHNFGHVAGRIDPETTLWVVISKSYTTAETLANTVLAYDFMEKHGLDPGRHVVTVTAKGSPGDDPDNPVLETFHMFDFIGGRYSVTSAVGGVPISLSIGYDRFEEFLKGAEEMDRHALKAPPRENLPMLAALIGIWNNNCLGYEAQSIIPYADPLCKLAPHVQQLYMESNGKSVTADGRPIDGKRTGVIIFGEPGTNAQHSFFQLAHQGRPFPIDFIGVLHPQYTQYTSKSKGVTNHQELWANLLSQPMALAMGKDDENPAKRFDGNRPSSTILLEDLSPRNIGRLLAFYEHRTVFEAFAWGINPFDQFGVELGKTMASAIRSCLAGDEAACADIDPINRFYTDHLKKGGMPGG